MAFRTLTAILVLPAVISLALLLVNAAWYQSSMLRMEEVAALKVTLSGLTVLPHGYPGKGLGRRIGPRHV